MFQVSSLAEGAALAALADAEHVQRAIENNAAGERVLTQGLEEMGIKAGPTWANFLFCRIGEDARSLCRQLQEEGVIVRPLADPWGAPDALRVTIGTPRQNVQFLETLKRVRARVPA